jgi:hypothetical protein
MFFISESRHGIEISSNWGEDGKIQDWIFGEEMNFWKRRNEMKFFGEVETEL